MLIKYLSDNLVLTTDFIQELANTADDRYNKFSVPKKNGGTRVIYQPQKELKLIQRVLHDDFLKKIIAHPACSAYCDGSSVKKNAERHKSNKYLLRLDFVDFFKSITSNDVLHFLADNKLHNDWTTHDTELFLKLVCFKGRLTMGGVTSPILSNLVCNNLDVAINDISISLGITYSRYADDIYLSTNNPNILFCMPGKVISLLRSIEYPNYLILNTKKTNHSSKKNKMMITGLILTNDGEVSLGRKKKREIKTLVYIWETLSIERRKYLQGYLSYCASVEPLFINSLCEKFSAKKIKDIQSYKFQSSNSSVPSKILTK
ncbi:retron St85 family RNA-directed DNA polymerase [Yersinia proxima]|uniref:retron St85 family RNA-directed DNA polymerase n=1 Tax=Yersinia proxima TaxID=2890316 RepID=UPI001D0FFA46|nr:retron St85 family RNA-directed DNA polymerase [Yersinia proxima]EKN3600675.1 retron St85 family RNA-directed DNA polymerase [Yersinia enterocolitica]